MLNIILDTNVLVATLLKPTGPNARLLRILLSNRSLFQIYFSSQMFAEYEDVLSRPIITARGLSNEAQGLLEIIHEVGEEIIPKHVPALVYPDRDDKPFLEAAVYVEGCLITNNLKDFPFTGVTVIGPDDFLQWLEEREQ